MASHDIAIVGLGVTFPGLFSIFFFKEILLIFFIIIESSTKETFLENILARRAQFREYPDCRLPLSQYYHPDRSTPDKTYLSFIFFILALSFVVCVSFSHHNDINNYLYL